MRLAIDHGAVFIDYQRLFDDARKRAPAHHWLWDGVHPTEAGHRSMADEWELVVKAKWGDLCS